MVYLIHLILLEIWDRYGVLQCFTLLIFLGEPWTQGHVLAQSSQTLGWTTCTLQELCFWPQFCANVRGQNLLPEISVFKLVTFAVKMLDQKQNAGPGR